MAHGLLCLGLFLNSLMSNYLLSTSDGPEAAVYAENVLVNKRDPDPIHGANMLTGKTELIGKTNMIGKYRVLYGYRTSL